MTEAQCELIDCVRGAMTECFPNGLSVTNPVELYNLSKNHDMAHFIGFAVEAFQLPVSDIQIRELFRQQYYQALHRIIILENDISKIKNIFDTYGIDYIPLKGAVIRKLYPEKWMRVSSDIDILIHPDDLKKAERLLVDQLDFVVINEGSHHDQVISPTGFHVDLHFQLTEREEKATPILNDVWNRCTLVEGKAHEYQMNDEMFYLFHMFHAAVHFQLGGPGIRPVLDTWLLNHKVKFDSEQRRILLHQGGLLRFAEIIEGLSEAWFSGAESIGMEDLEDYIFKGGLYGEPQRIAAVQAKNKNRSRYLLSRAFPSANTLKAGEQSFFHKWPVLLPFFWIYRLADRVAQGKGRRALHEIKKSKEETNRSREILELFKKMGLS